MSWIRSRLFWKPVSIYLVLSALVMLGFLAVLTRTLEVSTQKVLERKFRETLLRIAASDTPPEDAADLKSLSTAPRQILQLCDDESTVIAAINSFGADGNPVGVNDGLRQSLIREAERRGATLNWRSESPHIIVGAIRLEHRGDPRFVLSMQDLSATISEAVDTKWSAMRAVGMTWLCATALLLFVARTTVRPVRTMMQVVRLRDHAANRDELLGDLTERDDEFGAVARTIIEIDSERQNHLEDLEQQKKELGSTATQLSAILQAMADGVIAVDGDERIQFANSLACRLMDIEPDRIEQRPVFEVIRNTHVNEAVHEALRKQQEVSVEIRLARNDSYVSLTVSPVRSGGAVLVLHDTTELRKLEVMRRDFVSAVSHELKTPLTVIQACTDTLLEGAIEDQEAARTFLQQIEEQSERLLHLILGMLQLARVESGQQVFTEEPVDLREIAENTARGMAPVAESRSISLSVHGEEELFVLGDYQAMRTVASSLLDNALKYTPEGGEVRVELESQEAGLCFRVVDNGIGIPRKHHERVFERFFRVDRDRNREGGGTGLGLAIVKHLCQAMNAEIVLESSAGRGCTIEVQFPAE